MFLIETSLHNGNLHETSCIWRAPSYSRQILLFLGRPGSSKRPFAAAAAGHFMRAMDGIDKAATSGQHRRESVETRELFK